MRFSAEVTKVVQHTADVASYWLRSSRRLPRFRAGQFLQLTVDPYDPSGFWPDSRPFSVANGVRDRRELRITVSRQGAYTGRILDELRPGQEIWAKGPYGSFVIGSANDFADVVLLAGGTGVTPFAAFMDQSLGADSMPLGSVRLYYGARSPDLLLYRALAERCAERFSNFSVRFFAEVGADDEGEVEPGLLPLDEVLDEISSPADTSFYLSGPAAMISAFRHRLLQEPGVTDRHILLDAWE